MTTPKDGACLSMDTLRIENHRRKGFNADFQAEELEEGLLPALLSPFKRRFGTYRNLLN